MEVMVYLKLTLDRPGGHKHQEQRRDIRKNKMYQNQFGQHGVLIYKIVSSHFDLKLWNLTKLLLEGIYFHILFDSLNGCGITKVFMGLKDFKSMSGFPLLTEDDSNPEID